MQTLTPLALNSFTGSENYYQHFFKVFVYTDGVRYLADKASAYWLIDAIASYQTKAFLADPALRKFQLWKLEVKDSSAVLTCQKDKGKPTVVEQEIVYTDFPLPEVTLYLIDKVLLLPSKY